MIRGASTKSEMVNGAETRRFPDTLTLWFDAMLLTASLSSPVRCACSSTSQPTFVSRRLRVERSISRTASCFSSSATRRLTGEVGISRRRAARTKCLLPRLARTSAMSSDRPACFCRYGTFSLNINHATSRWPHPLHLDVKELYWRYYGL
jgi:hypothetical protein